MAMILQTEPDHNSSDMVYFDVFMTNNDSGAVYNSATLSNQLVGGVAQQLQQLPVNQSYSVSDLVQQIGVSLRGPPTAEIRSGWNVTKSADGAIALNHIAGIPNVSYIQWKATQQAPNQDTAALTFGVPTSRLELNGTAGYQPSPTGTWQPGYDAMLAKSTTQIPQMFTGRYDAVNAWTGNGNAMLVVPEPATGIFLGAAIGYVAASSKVRRALRHVANLF